MGNYRVSDSFPATSATGVRRANTVSPVPRMTGDGVDGSLSMAQVLSEKESGAIVQRTIRQDTLRAFFRTIEQADAVLVLNYSKRGSKNHVGGHVLVEMAFAHVLGKELFLLNPIPNVPYRDLIDAMQPVVVNGVLHLLTEKLPTRREASIR